MIPHRGRGRIKGWKKKPAQSPVTPQSLSAGEADAAAANATEEAAAERVSESDGEEHTHGESTGAGKLQRCNRFFDIICEK
jgi:hypothetical protein